MTNQAMQICLTHQFSTSRAVIEIHLALQVTFCLKWSYYVPFCGQNRQKCVSWSRYLRFFVYAGFLAYIQGCFWQMAYIPGYIRLLYACQQSVYHSSTHGCSWMNRWLLTIVHQLKASGLLTELATAFALFFALLSLVLVLFKHYTNLSKVEHWQESHRALWFCRSAGRSALRQYMHMQMNFLESQQNHGCIYL